MMLYRIRNFTNVERIILAHLAGELVSNPVTNSRTPVSIKPSSPLDFSNDPFLLTLFSEHPTEPSIISTSPERKVEKEKDLRGMTWQEKEDDEL